MALALDSEGLICPVANAAAGISGTGASTALHVAQKLPLTRRLIR
jgi:hypothetical protein